MRPHLLGVGYGFFADEALSEKVLLDLDVWTQSMSVEVRWLTVQESTQGCRCPLDGSSLVHSVTTNQYKYSTGLHAAYDLQRRPLFFFIIISITARQNGPKTIAHPFRKRSPFLHCDKMPGIRGVYM